MTLRIGTRGSPLALWQAHFVGNRLRALHAGLTVELVEIQTAGDQIRDVPLASFGGEGVFTKAIQDAFFGIVRGEVADRHGWLTPVPVASGGGAKASAEPAAAPMSARHR